MTYFVYENVNGTCRPDGNPVIFTGSEQDCFRHIDRIAPDRESRNWGGDLRRPRYGISRTRGETERILRAAYISAHIA